MAHGTRALVGCAGHVKWKTQGRYSYNITGPRFKKCGGIGAPVVDRILLWSLNGFAHDLVCGFRHRQFVC